jgi:DNA-binding CsgD family transcriptional regulator
MGTPQPERSQFFTSSGDEERPNLRLVDQEEWLADEDKIKEKYGLTKKELHLLGSLATGFVNKQIAHKGNISTHSVRKALAGTYPKIGVKNRLQAELWARKELSGEDVGGYQILVNETGITQRELEVLRCLMEGVVDPFDIADRLFITYDTTRSHQKHIYKKLGAHSRDEAIAKAQTLISSHAKVDNNIDLYRDDIR